MTAAPTLQWETLDLKVAYPETAYRAAGGECEYRIAHYRPATDGKAFANGSEDLWTLSTHPIGGVTYHESLDTAKTAAQNWEDEES